MSFSDCEKCWDTPCTCGHDWEGFALKKLEEFVAMLNRIIEKKKKERGEDDAHWGR